MYFLICIRAVGRSENPGVPVLFGGHYLPPLVEIGLTDQPKSGGAMAPRHPSGTAGLCSFVSSSKDNEVKLLLEEHYFLGFYFNFPNIVGHNQISPGVSSLGRGQIMPTK